MLIGSRAVVVSLESPQRSSSGGLFQLTSLAAITGEKRIPRNASPIRKSAIRETSPSGLKRAKTNTTPVRISLQSIGHGARKNHSCSGWVRSFGNQGKSVYARRLRLLAELRMDDSADIWKPGFIAKQSRIQCSEVDAQIMFDEYKFEDHDTLEKARERYAARRIALEQMGFTCSDIDPY